MLAVLHLLLLGWVGVATTAWVAPSLRPATSIAVGLGMSFAVTLGASTALLLLLGPTSLPGLAYLLAGTAFVASLGLVLRRRGVASSVPQPLSWPSLAVPLVALLAALQANLAGTPGYNPATLFFFMFGSYVAGSGATYPALWAFGNEYVLPFMQLKYALMFPSMLWSDGDPIEFLHTGAPALCVLLTASVSFVGYEFFRLHARPMSAVLLSAIWLTGCLDYKFYSVRAETIAWIPAFSFLIAFTMALRERSSRALWFLSAALLVTTSLLHGIVFLVAACMGACLWLAVLCQNSPPLRIGLLRATLAAAGVAVGFLVVVYYGAHTKYTRGESRSFVEMEKTRPTPGRVDPTRRFFDLYMNRSLGETTARIGQSPPAVSLRENISVALTQPLRRPFPRASAGLNQAILTSGLLAVAWLLYRRPRLQPWSGLLLGFALTIVFLFTLSVILNYRSYGWFPWAVVERRFVRYVSTSEAMLLVGSLLTIFQTWASRPWRRRLVSLALVVASGLVLATVRDRTLPREKSRILKPEFAAMAGYLRGHHQAGDRAVSSWGSMGHMRYLTGIPHDSEGVMPFEVSRLIDQNTRSLERTRRFLDDPNEAYVGATGVRYVVITWRRRPPGSPFSHAPIAEFERLGRLVLRNDDYAVFDTKAAPLRPDPEASPPTD